MNTQGRTMVWKNRMTKEVTSAVVLDGFSGADTGRVGL
jgi:hypothetical protein